MKYFTTGSSGVDYLLLNQNMYSISKLSSTYVVSVIECNIEEKWMTVKQRWKYEMEWSEVNLDCLVQEDIINISDRGDRWEGNSLYGVPFGFGCYYNEENVLTYKGFVFDNKKMCYAKKAKQRGRIQTQRLLKVLCSICRQIGLEDNENGNEDVKRGADAKNDTGNSCKLSRSGARICRRL